MTTLMRTVETVDRKTRLGSRDERGRRFDWDRSQGPQPERLYFRGRIHDCTRIVSRKVRFFSLAPQAPSIHDPERVEAVIALVVSLLRARLLQGRREMRT